MVVSKGMKVMGTVSALTGMAGSSLPSMMFDNWFGYIVSLGLFLCVGAAHNWVAGGRMD